MYLFRVLTFGLFALALCVPLTATVWRQGGLRQQQEFLAYKREKWREQIAALDANAKKDRDALAGQCKALEARVAKLETDVKRAEQGREIVRRVGT